MIPVHQLSLVSQSLRQAFAALPRKYAYGALVGVLLFEGTGLPLVPFEPLFVATAVLIASGRLDLWLVVVTAAGGDLVGNVLGYGLGRSVGQLVVDRFGPRVGLSEERLASVRRWFWHFGGRTLLVARFFGPIRTPAILLAGLSRMPIGTYIFWCALADVLWVLCWQVAILRFGRLALHAWQRFGTPVAATAFGLLVVAAVLAILWRKAGGSWAAMPWRGRGAR